MRSSARDGDATDSVDPPSATVCSSLERLLRAAPRVERPVRCCAVGYVAAGKALRPDRCFRSHRLEGMKSHPHARQERQASSVSRPLEGPTETKKARSVVALSRVPRLARYAGSPPAAGLSWAVNRPLVRIPADRHTTTGTCDLGEKTNWANRRDLQEFFSRFGEFFGPS